MNHFNLEGITLYNPNTQRMEKAIQQGKYWIFKDGTRIPIKFEG